MSKALRVIANILLIIFLVVAAAQLVPPLVGVTTVVATPDVSTNLQTGSVAYGLRKNLSTLSSGDKIVYSNDKSAYVYEIVEIDPGTGEVTVRTSENSSTDVLKLRKTASKKLLVIPYIGYMTIAMQSREGLIILGLVIAVIIVLYIISAVAERRALDDEEDEDDDAYFRDLALSYSKPHDVDRIVEPLPSERASAASQQRTVMEFEPIGVADVMNEEEIAATKVFAGAAAGAAAETAAKEESTPEAMSPEMPEKIEASKEDEVKAPEKEPVQEIELAIPVRSAEEILEQAYAAGLDPLVTKDELSGISFVDFSDCL